MTSTSSVTHRLTLVPLEPMAGPSAEGPQASRVEPDLAFFFCLFGVLMGEGAYERGGDHESAEIIGDLLQLSMT